MAFGTSKHATEAERAWKICADHAALQPGVKAFAAELGAPGAFKDRRAYGFALFRIVRALHETSSYPAMLHASRHLLEFAVARWTEKETGPAHDATLEADFRASALAFIAKALTKLDWDGDGCSDFGAVEQSADAACEARALRCKDATATDDDCHARRQAEAYVARILDAPMTRGRPYDRELQLATAEALYTARRPDTYRQAALLYQHIADARPEATDAPVAATRVIESYDGAQDWERMRTSRAWFLSLFRRDSRWFALHHRQEVLVRIMDGALLRITSDYGRLLHANAQLLRERGRLAQARIDYTRAAAAYGAALDRAPDNPRAYELAWGLAESLYWSEAWAAAALRYAAVRDWTGPRWPKDADHADEAAFLAAECLSSELARRVKLPAADKDHLDARADPRSAPSDATLEALKKAAKPGDKPGIVRVQAEAMPEPAKAWLGEADVFLARGFKVAGRPEAASHLALDTARMVMKYGLLDEARRRFGALVKGWPKSAAARAAAFDWLATYAVEGDAEGLAMTRRFLNSKGIAPAER